MRTKSSEKAASDDHGVPLARDAVREGEWGPWCASCPSCVPGPGRTWAHGGVGLGSLPLLNPPWREEWKHAHPFSSVHMVTHSHTSPVGLTKVISEFPGARVAFPALPSLPPPRRQPHFLSCGPTALCVHFLSPNKTQSLQGQRSVFYSQSMWC